MAIGSPSTTSKIRRTPKSLTFTGAAGVGAVGSVTLYTVTGDVWLHGLIIKCTTNLTEAGATATMALGTVNQTSRFIAATNAVDIDANELWVSTTPTPYSLDLPDAMQAVIIVQGDDIIITVGAQNVNGGVIECVALWEPISTDGSLVAA